MSLASVALGPLVLSIAVYVALVLFMLTTRPVEPSRSGARRGSKGRHNHLPLVLRPVGSAISCVVDVDERDWTWKQYIIAVLLPVLLTVLVMALLALLVAGLYVWTLR